MQIEKEKDIKCTFILTADDVRSICQHFSGAERIEFRALCKDEVTRMFANLDELLAYDNIPAKSIHSVGIHVYRKSHPRSVSLGFLRSGTASMKFADEESVVERDYEFILGKLSGLRPWYAFLHGRTYWGVSRLVAVCFVLLILFRMKVPPAAGEVFTYWVPIGIGLGLSVIFFAFDTLFVNQFFPPGVFAIGNGAKAHADREVIRTVLIASAAISVVTGLFVTYLFS